jgi:hypothetical protein
MQKKIIQLDWARYTYTIPFGVLSLHIYSWNLTPVLDGRRWNLSFNVTEDISFST